jgi:dipeptidyl aminopeptidase/acylaminoacyl peptidase
MLAHGLEDRRVDFEQSLRLARMLSLAGHRPVGLAFAGEAHGLAQPENIDRLWNGVAGFLQQSLGAPAARASSPAAEH